MGFRYIERIGFGVNVLGMSCEIREDTSETSLETPPRRVEEDFPVWPKSVSFRLERLCKSYLVFLRICTPPCESEGYQRRIRPGHTETLRWFSELG